MAENDLKNLRILINFRITKFVPHCGEFHMKTHSVITPLKKLKTSK